MRSPPGVPIFYPKPVQADDLFKQLEVHLGLQWTYATDSTSKDAKQSEDLPLTPPPQEELTTLMNLAKGGKNHGHPTSSCHDWKSLENNMHPL